MGKYTTYEFKIEPKYYKDVYRIIRIDGSKTLDNLCGEILSAFDFDDDHLYMFSLRRIKFDNEGYYHPEASGGKSADKISLNALNLKARNKFLFLYDFGDEWLFDITVRKIEQSEILSLTYVKEKSGEILQYPDWEDDEWEDEEFSDESDLKNELVFMDSNKSMAELLSNNKPSELKSIMKVLGIKVPKVSKRASVVYAAEIMKFLSSNKEKLFDLLTPSAAYSLLYIAKEDNDTVIPEILEILSIDVLTTLGLVEISDENDSLIIEVTKELYEFADYINNPKNIELIKQSYKWQKVIEALINLYGVADLEILYKYLCNYLKDDIDFGILDKLVFVPMAYWGGMEVLTNKYIKIATLLNEEQTEFILSERNNYDVEDYKKYEDEELSTMITGGIIGFVPSIQDLAEYLMFDKQVDPSEVASFISELSTACLLCADQDIILEMCEENLDENSLKFTKKVRNLILKVIKQHPCSFLKGYSWDEYNNRDKVIDNQISFFDDLGDLPF